MAWAIILILLGLATIGIALILLVINIFLKKPKMKYFYASIAGFVVVVTGLFVFIATVDTSTVDNPDLVAGNTKKEVTKDEDDEKIKQQTAKEDEKKDKAEEDELARQENEAKATAEQKAKEETAAKAKAEEEVKKKQDELAASLALEAVTVSRVIDGDTVELSDGRKIRLVGVNTPESTTRTEEYGKEASNYTKSKLDGKQVWIQKDVSDTDRYQRYLRIIWLAVPTDDMNESEIRSKMFNADLVLNGYAEPSTYPPDVKYSEYFVKFAREARANNTGLWAFGENGTTKGDLDPKETAKTNTSTNTNKTTNSAPAPKPKTTPAPPPQPATSSACNIKGNQSGIYHVPGGAYYDRTNAEEMFCTEEEAQAAGYRKSKR